MAAEGKKKIQNFCILQWSFSHLIKFCKTQILGIGTLLATNSTELGNHRFGKHRYWEPKASIQNNTERTANNGYTTEDEYESPEQQIIMIMNMYQDQIQQIIKSIIQHVRYGQRCCISTISSLTPWFSKFQVFQQTRGTPNFSKPFQNYHKYFVLLMPENIIWLVAQTSSQIRGFDWSTQQKCIWFQYFITLTIL